MFPYCYTPWNDFASPPPNPLLPVPPASQRDANESVTAFPPSLTHTLFFFFFNKLETNTHVFIYIVIVSKGSIQRCG